MKRYRFQLTVHVIDSVVGLATILLWKMTETTTKNPKKRIWTKRPTIMTFSPSFILLADFAPVRMAPPT
jgi:hypothetical protein